MQGIPLTQTIKKRRDFLAARSGARFHGRFFVLQAVRRKDGTYGDCVRFGYTATKRIGNAVVRNRIKRRLRSVVADMPADILILCGGLDIVMIAREAALTSSYSEMVDDLNKGLARLVAKDQLKGQ